MKLICNGQEWKVMTAPESWRTRPELVCLTCRQALVISYRNGHPRAFCS